MENVLRRDPTIEAYLLDTGAYRDLEKPVILTSGKLGIYYINTENLLADGGKWKEYGDDASEMMKHSLQVTQVNDAFWNTCTEIADYVLKLEPDIISGGQRRDWPFASVVARELGIPFVAMYKDGRMEFFNGAGYRKENTSIKGERAVHIADLLTAGSSANHKEDGVEKGWIPWLRAAGAEVDDMVSVVTRQQGGEKVLNDVGVNSHSFVAIDRNFLGTNSNFPDRALVYARNPEDWTKKHLKEEGALCLVGYFDPEGGQLDRAKKFLDAYGSFLREVDRWDELDGAVSKKYGPDVTLDSVRGRRVA